MDVKEREEKYPKSCMFQDKICTRSCRGWDYEHNDCRMIGMLWKITEALNWLKEDKEDSYYGGF